MTDELWLLHTRCGLTPEELRTITLNGFRHAFLHWEDKQALLAEAEQTLPHFDEVTA